MVFPKRKTPLYFFLQCFGKSVTRFPPPSSSVFMCVYTWRGEGGVQRCVVDCVCEGQRDRCMYVSIYVHTYTHIYTRIYLSKCIYVCMYMYVRVYMYAYIYIYIRMYICKYLHKSYWCKNTYTYTHISICHHM